MEVGHCIHCTIPRTADRCILLYRLCHMDTRCLCAASYLYQGTRVIQSNDCHRPLQKKRKKSCPQCNKKIPSHEEKESDVSFGIYIVHQAHIDGFDKAFIITADSDFLPVIKLVSEYFPKKEIHLLIPPGRYKTSRDLRNSIKSSKIKRKHLENNLFPERVRNDSGDIITRPEKYQPLLQE